MPNVCFPGSHYSKQHRLWTCCTSVVRFKIFDRIPAAVFKSSVAKSSAVAVISDMVRQEMVNFCKMQKRNTNNLNSLLNFKWTSFLNVANRISSSIVQLLTKKRYHKSATKRSKSGKTISFVPILGMILSILSMMRSRHNVHHNVDRRVQKKGLYRQIDGYCP